MTPILALEKIEKKYSYMRSQIFKEMIIWENIAMEINSSEGEELKFWYKVMDEYYQKYRTLKK